MKAALDICPTCRTWSNTKTPALTRCNVCESALERYVKLEEAVNVIKDLPEYPDPCPKLREIAMQASDGDTDSANWIIHMVRATCRATKSEIISELSK